MRAAAVRAAQAIGYDSVGTIECLVAGSHFFFLEMNTRIQVEHTVTEMVTGMDLIREQIRVAAGEPLGFLQDDIRFDGFAIEGRVNAEDPSQDFRPAPGTIGTYREPGGPGVRVDSAAYPGMTISADYDSMIAKLIVWAPTRRRSIARFKRAIDEFAIDGVPTTLPLLRALCDDPNVIEGDYGTATLEAFAALHRESLGSNVTAGTPSEAAPSDEIRVEVNDRMYRVRLVDRPSSAPHQNGANGRRSHRAPPSARTRRQAATMPSRRCTAS